jgi:hypothetical protein
MPLARKAVGASSAGGMVRACGYLCGYPVGAKASARCASRTTACNFNATPEKTMRDKDLHDSMTPAGMKPAVGPHEIEPVDDRAHRDKAWQALWP